MATDVSKNAWTGEAGGGPRYREIAKALHGELLKGAWRPGERIPAEPELERRFGVSRGTLRAAVAELVQAGLLQRQAGRGTFVLSPQFTQSFGAYFGFERRDRTGPIAFQTVCLATGRIIAGARQADALGLAPGERIGHVRRLRVHEGEPFLVEDSYFPPKLWARIAKADFTVTALYEHLRERFDLHMLPAEDYLTAEPAAPEFAALLRTGVGAPAICIERTTLTFENAPAEFRLSVGRSDGFRYHARLR
jgi:GntR family transcriptional regulator